MLSLLKISRIVSGKLLWLCLTAQAKPLDINFSYRPNDSHHLIVHERSGFEPGDAEGF